VLAKAAVYGTPGPWAGRQWWTWILPAELGEWPSQLEPLGLFQLRLLLAPAAVVGLIATRRTPLRAFAWPMLAVWAVQIVVGPTYFFWYFAVPAIATFALAAAGLPRIVRGRAIYVGLLLLLAGAWTMQFGRGYRVRSRGEVRVFGTIADALADHARPGQTVLLEPIGWIGWRNPGLHVVDEVGLVSPDIPSARRHTGWYADLVTRIRPEWLVVRTAFLSSDEAFAGAGQPFRSSDEHKRILADYRPIAASADPPGDQDLILLERAPSTR
jgi:hypothetical protein